MQTSCLSKCIIKMSYNQCLLGLQCPNKEFYALKKCQALLAVAPFLEVGLSIDVSLQDYALQPIIQNDIKTLSKIDITDSE